HPGDATAVPMHLHHDAVRLCRRFLKHGLEHVYDEIHRRVIVVEEYDLEQRRILLLGLDALLDGSIRIVLLLRHEDRVVHLRRHDRTAALPTLADARRWQRAAKFASEPTHAPPANPCMIDVTAVGSCFTQIRRW